MTSEPHEYCLTHDQPADWCCKVPEAYVDCPKHGRQLALNVPGLTSEPTCIECI